MFSNIEKTQRILKDACTLSVFPDAYTSRSTLQIINKSIPKSDMALLVLTGKLGNKIQRRYP
jgi:hypothetical protein